MIDFIKATKYDCKDNVFLGHCTYKGEFEAWDYYVLEGCEKVKIRYNSKHHLIQISGSMPYYLNGHNFTFSTGELIQAVDQIDSVLGSVGLWGAVLDEFENGVIMPVETKPQEYIRNHYAGKGSGLKMKFNESDKWNFVRWEKSGEVLKMYDAGANILMKQNLKRKEVIREAGWNPEGNYVKFEVRYLKPDMINKNKPIRLDKLQNLSFIETLNTDIMNQYELLTPAKTLILPDDKKDFTSLDAVLITLAQSQGVPLDQVKRMIYETINKAECLSKADKDSRKAQIRKAFSKLEEDPSSRWDLAGKIQEALGIEGQITPESCDSSLNEYLCTSADKIV